MILSRRYPKAKAKVTIQEPVPVVEPLPLPVIDPEPIPVVEPVVEEVVKRKPGRPPNKPVTEE